MRVGTKSLIFGVHQVLWHPITVWIAWVKLYGVWPSWKETVCIVIHDWGYWGSPNMDGEEGERHPEWAAKIAGRLFGPEYHDLCLYHSRHYCRNTGTEPSRLCWADKLSICYESWWWYLPRAMASGELTEYREKAAGAGVVPARASHREWFAVIQNRLMRLGREMDPTVVPYVNRLTPQAPTPEET